MVKGRVYCGAPEVYPSCWRRLQRDLLGLMCSLHSDRHAGTLLEFGGVDTISPWLEGYERVLLAACTT